MKKRPWHRDFSIVLQPHSIPQLPHFLLPRTLSHWFWELIFNWEKLKYTTCFKLIPNSHSYTQHVCTSYPREQTKPLPEECITYWQSSECRLYQSAWAAITKCHRLDDENTETHFLILWEADKSRVRLSSLSCDEGFLLLAWPLLGAHTQGDKRALWCLFHWHWSSWIGIHLTFSSLEGPSPSTAKLEFKL